MRRKTSFEPSCVVLHNLRRLMRERSMSQKHLALTLNVTEGTVSLWVNGKVEPSPRSLVELARAFQIPRESFFSLPAATNIRSRAAIAETPEWTCVTDLLGALSLQKTNRKMLGCVSYLVTLSPKTLHRYSTPSDDHKAASDFRDEINRQLRQLKLGYRAMRRELQVLIVRD